VTQSDDSCFDDYSAEAVAAIMRAARNERDFLAWLVAVLGAVAAEFKPSPVLTVKRPSSWERGPSR
jgi:hypothetical protein